MTWLETMRRRPILSAAVVLALTCFLIYGRSLANDFVIWDDDNLVFDNPIVVSVTPQTIAKAFTSYDPELYVPLTILSYQIERVLFGFTPFFFHLDNLLLHTGCCILLFTLLRKLGLSDVIALGASLTFAVHPINTEAVAWVSARKDLLCTIFSLASLVAFCAHREGRKNAWMLSVGFLLLALLSKATAVIVPLLMILIDWWKGRLTRTRIFQITPQMIFSAVFVIIALYGKSRNLSEVSTLETILLSFKSFAFSLKQFFVPTDISILYLQLDNISYIQWTFALSIGLFIILLLLSFLTITHSKVLHFSLAWYLLCLAPSFANFSKGGTIFYFSDRYIYLAQVGLLVGIGWVIQKALARSSAGIRQISAATFLIVLITLASLSYKRSLVWASSETLYRDALSKNERSVTIHYNLGRLEQQRSNTEEAIKQYERALELNPRYVNAMVNIAMLRNSQGKTDEALQMLSLAAQIDPKAPEPRNNIGAILMNRGQIDAGIKEFQEAILIDPNFAQAHINLADAYGKKNMFEEGLNEYRTAFSLDPRLREIYPEAARLLEAF